jgi:hypothetical protein
MDQARMSPVSDFIRPQFGADLGHQRTSNALPKRGTGRPQCGRRT